MEPLENLINALEELFIKYNVEESDIVIIEDAINSLNAMETEDESDYTEDEYEEGIEEDYESDYE